MLFTIAALLLILWLLGMVSSYTLGGFIHILLILAIIVVLVRIIQGRSPVLNKGRLQFRLVRLVGPLEKTRATYFSTLQPLKKTNKHSPPFFI
ncbi:MAG: lmo0937 family membrane protein [Candidatus Sulfotelmatobacter sp.]